MKKPKSKPIAVWLVILLILFLPGLALCEDKISAKDKYNIGKSVEPTPPKVTNKPYDWSVKTNDAENLLNKKLKKLKELNAKPAQYQNALKQTLAESDKWNAGRLKDLNSFKNKAGVSGLAMTGTPPGVKGYCGILSDAEHVNVNGAKFNKIIKTAENMGYTTQVKGDRVFIKELNAEFYRGPTAYSSPSGSSAAELEMGAKLYDKEFAGGMKVKYNPKTGKPWRVTYDPKTGKEILNLTQGPVKVEAWDKHLYSKDLVKKGGYTLNKNVMDWKKGDWRTAGKMTSRMMANGGVVDQDFLNKCKQLKERVPPEALGLVTPEQKKAFFDKVQKYNNLAYQNTKNIYQAKANTLNNRVKNATKHYARAIKGGNKGAIAKAKKALKNAKTNAFNYRTKHHYANKSISRPDGGSASLMKMEGTKSFQYKGTKTTVSVQISPKGKVSYLNAKTGEIIPESRVREMVLKKTEMKMIKASKPVSGLKTKAGKVVGKGMTALNYLMIGHMIYSGAKMGAEKAIEHTDADESAAKTLGRLLLYEAVYATPLGKGLEMGAKANMDSWTEYYDDKIAGKNPWASWAYVRSIGYGTLNFFEDWANLKTIEEKYLDFEGFQVDVQMMLLAEKQALHMESRVRQKKWDKEVEAIIKDLKSFLSNDPESLTDEQKAMLEHDRMQTAWERAVGQGLLDKNQYNQFKRGYNKLTGQYDPELAAKKPVVPDPKTVSQKKKPPKKKRKLASMIQIDVSKEENLDQYDKSAYTYTFKIGFKENLKDRYSLISSRAVNFQKQITKAAGSVISQRDMKRYTIDDVLDIFYQDHDLVPELDLQVTKPDETVISNYPFGLGWKGVTVEQDTSFTYEYLNAAYQIQKKRAAMVKLEQKSEKKLKQLIKIRNKSRSNRIQSKAAHIAGIETAVKKCYSDTASEGTMHFLGTLQMPTKPGKKIDNLKTIKDETGYIILSGNEYESEPVFQYSDEDRKDPYFTCRQADDIKGYLSGKNIDFSDIDKRYEKDRKFTVQQKEKGLVTLGQEKLNSQKKLQEIIHNATTASQDFLSEKTETTPESSRNYAIVNGEYTILKSNLFEFKEEHLQSVTFKVLFPPAQPVWGNEIPEPLAFIQTGQTIFPIRSMQEAFTVVVRNTEDGETLAAYKIPVIGKNYLKFQGREKQTWGKKQSSLNGKVGRFLSGFTENIIDCAPRHRQKMDKQLESITQMFFPEGVESYAVYFDSFGLLEEYQNAIQTTRDSLLQKSTKALQNIKITWEDLFDKAGEIFNDRATQLELAHDECQKSQTAAPNLDDFLEGENKTNSDSPKFAGNWVDNSNVTKGLPAPPSGWVDTPSDNASDSSTGSSLNAPLDYLYSTPEKKYQGKKYPVKKDPNPDLERIFNEINAEARRALDAMNLKYDCAARVKKHHVNLSRLLDQMMNILKSVNVRKDVRPDLRKKIAQWSKDNIRSHQDLLSKSKDVGKMKMPAMPTGKLQPKIKKRYQDHRNKIKNMKKVYRMNTPVYKNNLKRFSIINKLVGGTGKAKAKSNTTYDSYESGVYQKTRKMIKDLENNFDK